MSYRNILVPVPTSTSLFANSSENSSHKLSFTPNFERRIMRKALSTLQARLKVQDSPATSKDNTTLFQGFEWYLPSDGQHYQRLARSLESLKHLGVDQVWLPPGCKAGWQGSNGYDIYDLYDLGEFDQKGFRGTKFGDKQALTHLSNLAGSIGIKLCWDAVLNHKCAADYTEKCQAVKVDKEGMYIPCLPTRGCSERVHRSDGTW